MNINLCLFNKKLLLPLWVVATAIVGLSGGLQAQSARLSGVINRYVAVTNIDIDCPGRIRVSDTTGFRPGMSVLLWQTKGATINRGNNGGHGNITSLNGAGAIERNEIVSVVDGAVVLKYQLVQKFDPAGLVQLISLPKYANATVIDTLRPLPWDGRIGGLLALEVTGTLTMNAPAVADGAGFRGGEAVRVANNNCNWVVTETAFIYGLGNWRGGRKGEGIAPMQAGQELGRGPLATGGGGGNDHNSGGGGGSNRTAGGNGGTNNDPANLTCDGLFPGVGGRAVAVSDFRLFPGGGGGSGHTNNNALQSSGAHGGGVIALWAGRIEGLKNQLFARGLPAVTAEGDGGGGGGGGGSIFLNVGGAINLEANADGGKGGDTNNSIGNRCFGPGGGGAGGYMCLNAAGVTTPKGGLPGRITRTTNGCNGSTSGAQAGSDGSLVPFATFPQSNTPNEFPAIATQPKAGETCTGRGASFVVKAVGDSLKLRYIWERNTGSGWTVVTESPETQGTRTTNLRLLTTDSTQNGHRYRCRVILPGCFEEASAEAALTVRPGPQAAFQVTQNGALVSFTAQVRNAAAWQWSFGDGRTSTAANPQHRYAKGGAFTVTLRAFAACDTAVVTRTLNIILPPDANFTIKDTLGCERATVRFDNRSAGPGTTWAWEFPGGTPATAAIAAPTVEYAKSGQFSARLIVRNEGGADTLLRKFAVDIQAQPRALFSYKITAPGTVQFTNESQFATRHAWDFGDQTPTVQELSPTHRYAGGGLYTVTLVSDNACGAAVFQRDVELSAFLAAGVERAQLAPKVKIYPNPTTGRLVIDSHEGGVVPELIRLFDATGRETMRSAGKHELVTEWQIDALPAGVYRVEARYPTGSVVRTIVKD